MSIQKLTNYVFCYKCNKIYAGSDVDAVINAHPDHDNESGTPFQGICVQTDFVTETEANQLMTGIDSMKWDISQSGRRKQVSISFIQLKAF